MRGEVDGGVVNEGRGKREKTENYIRWTERTEKRIRTRYERDTEREG